MDLHRSRMFLKKSSRNIEPLKDSLPKLDFLQEFVTKLTSWRNPDQTLFSWNPYLTWIFWTHLHHSSMLVRNPCQSLIFCINPHQTLLLLLCMYLLLYLSLYVAIISILFFTISLSAFVSSSPLFSTPWSYFLLSGSLLCKLLLLPPPPAVVPSLPCSLSFLCVPSLLWISPSSIFLIFLISSIITCQSPVPTSPSLSLSFWEGNPVDLLLCSMVLFGNKTSYRPTFSCSCLKVFQSLGWNQLFLLAQLFS